MSYWGIVVPEATENKVLNPSAETTGNFAGGVVTRSTTYQKYGLYSYRAQSAANGQGLHLTLESLANAIHYATFRVRGTLPAGGLTTTIDVSNYHVPTLIESIDENWNLYGVQLPAAQCNGSTTFYILQSGAGSGDWYVDGVQIEEKDYWTTYCDGSRPGCVWDGVANESFSTRAATARAGGRVRDLQDDFDFYTSGFLGAGYSPIMVNADSYADLPGAQFNSIKQPPRVFTITGAFHESGGWDDLQTKRQALIDVLAHDAYPADPGGWQPVTLRYSGAAVQKEIKAYYESGLEGSITASAPGYVERAAIRFFAPDPFFYEIGNHAIGLDTTDTHTVYNIAARLKSSKQWDNLGVGAHTSGGTVFQILRASTGDIYIGGSFTGWGGVAGRDYIARYDPQAETWHTIGSASDINGNVEAIAEGPDGTIYFGGLFTNAAGIANADYLVSWNGSSFSALGTGANGLVKSFAFDKTGIMYVGGAFTSIGGTAANRIASWDGSSFSALGTGLNNYSTSIAVGLDNTIYVGGFFSTAGGNTVNYVAQWDGTTWSDLDGGFTGTIVYDLVILENGNLVAGGIFTAASGNTLSGLAEWNGVSWVDMGGGVGSAGGNVQTLRLAPNNDLYISGAFTSAGGNDNIEYLTVWNGASFAQVDTEVPGVSIVYSPEFGPPDPINPNNFDLYIGFSTNGSVDYAGLVTIDNEGNQPVYPKMYFKRTGGTSTLMATFTNETTGRRLFFNYGLLDGETISINLEPKEKTVISDFFGQRFDAILPNSDFGELSLLPGDNEITVFLINNGAAITAWAEWVNAYKSAD